MAVYVVSYDLVAPGRNYQPLYDALIQVGARRILLSQWVLRSNQTATQIRDAVAQFVDVNDRIFVDELSPNNWAGLRLLFDPNNI